MDLVSVQVDNTNGEVKNLQFHVHSHVGWLHARLSQMEVANFYNRSAPIPTAMAGGSTAHRSEIPELPKADGEWRFAPDAGHEGQRRRPGVLVYRRVRENMKLTVVLCCLAFALCILLAGIARRSLGPPPPHGPRGPLLGPKPIDRKSVV